MSKNPSNNCRVCKINVILRWNLAIYSGQVNKESFFSENLLKVSNYERTVMALFLLLYIRQEAGIEVPKSKLQNNIALKKTDEITFLSCSVFLEKICVFLSSIIFVGVSGLEQNEIKMVACKLIKQCHSDINKILFLQGN